MTNHSVISGFMDFSTSTCFGLKHQPITSAEWLFVVDMVPKALLRSQTMSFIQSTALWEATRLEFDEIIFKTGGVSIAPMLNAAAVWKRTDLECAGECRHCHWDAG